MITNLVGIIMETFIKNVLLTVLLIFFGSILAALSWFILKVFS